MIEIPPVAHRGVQWSARRPSQEFPSCPCAVVGLTWRETGRLPSLFSTVKCEKRGLPPVPGMSRSGRQDQCHIKPNTIAKKARRRVNEEIGTNVPKEPENQKIEDMQDVKAEEHDETICPVCKKRKVSRRKLKSGAWDYSPKCPHCYKEARNQLRSSEVVHEQIDKTRDDQYWISIAADFDCAGCRHERVQAPIEDDPEGYMLLLWAVFKPGLYEEVIRIRRLEVIRAKREGSGLRRLHHLV